MTKQRSNQPPSESATCSTRILVKGKYQERTNSLVSLQETMFTLQQRVPITVTTISQGQKIIEYY